MKLTSFEERMRINRQFLESGVILYDSATCYIEEGVTIGAGTRILPNTVITGNTVIGKDCSIGPNTVIISSKIGDKNEIVASYLTEATVENETHIGPFSYLRPKAHIKSKAKIGDFVEIKNATIGEGTKASHLTYIGDADVGEGCNFGCGSVVVNYDGNKKHRSKSEIGRLSVAIPIWYHRLQSVPMDIQLPEAQLPVMFRTAPLESQGQNKRIKMDG